MSGHHLRITFYGRAEAIHIGIGEAAANTALAAVKGIAAGGSEIPAFFLFDLEDGHTALISVGEIQTLQFTAQAGSAPPLQGGVAFYLKGRPEPLVLDYAGKGPLDDMFHGLAETDYGEALPGCVMLTDGAGEPVFFRLDEIQYAIARTELVQTPS